MGFGIRLEWIYFWIALRIGFGTELELNIDQVIPDPYELLKEN